MDLLQGMKLKFIRFVRQQDVFGGFTNKNLGELGQFLLELLGTEDEVEKAVKSYLHPFEHPTRPYLVEPRH